MRRIAAKLSGQPLGIEVRVRPCPMRNDVWFWCVVEPGGRVLDNDTATNEAEAREEGEAARRQLV